jgi:AraC-like DNA-binding protein
LCANLNAGVKATAEKPFFPSWTPGRRTLPIRKLSADQMHLGFTKNWACGQRSLVERWGLPLVALKRKTSGTEMEHCKNIEFGKIREWKAKAIKSRFKPAKLASLCSLSLRQLERKFTLHWKITPREWLRRVQCLLARQLIKKGLTNKKVAKKLHFASQSHFSREFKKSFGVTPGSLAPRRLVTSRIPVIGRELAPRKARVDA